MRTSQSASHCMNELERGITEVITEAKIDYSYTKYEGKVYKFFPSVRRIGIRFVFDLLIYPDGFKMS